MCRSEKVGARLRSKTTRARSPPQRVNDACARRWMRRLRDMCVKLERECGTCPGLPSSAAALAALAVERSRTRSTCHRARPHLQYLPSSAVAPAALAIERSHTRSTCHRAQSHLRRRPPSELPKLLASKRLGVLLKVGPRPQRHGGRGRRRVHAQDNQRLQPRPRFKFFTVAVVAHAPCRAKVRQIEPVHRVKRISRSRISCRGRRRDGGMRLARPRRWLVIRRELGPRCCRVSRVVFRVLSRQFSQQRIAALPRARLTETGMRAAGAQSPRRLARGRGRWRHG